MEALKAHSNLLLNVIYRFAIKPNDKIVFVSTDKRQVLLSDTRGDCQATSVAMSSKSRRNDINLASVRT